MEFFEKVDSPLRHKGNRKRSMHVRLINVFVGLNGIGIDEYVLAISGIENKDHLPQLVYACKQFGSAIALKLPISLILFGLPFLLTGKIDMHQSDFPILVVAKTALHFYVCV